MQFLIPLQVETMNEDLKMLQELLLVESQELKEKREASKKDMPMLEKMYSEYIKIYGLESKELEDNSDDKRTSYEEYMEQVSDLDIDLLYTAYYQDFDLFGYEPWH